MDGSESATLADYAEDVRAAIRMLSDRKDVDRRRIAVVGHSEGGSLALMAAVEGEADRRRWRWSRRSASTGADLNMYQVTHALERANRPEAERQNTIELQRQIQQAVLTGKGWETISIPPAVRRQAETPWFQSYLAYDPAKVMKDVDQPLLIVQGALDVQVPPDNADKLEALAKRARRRSGRSRKGAGRQSPARAGEDRRSGRVRATRDVSVSPDGDDRARGVVARRRSPRPNSNWRFVSGESWSLRPDCRVARSNDQPATSPIHQNHW